MDKEQHELIVGNVHITAYSGGGGGSPPSAGAGGGKGITATGEAFFAIDPPLKPDVLACGGAISRHDREKGRPPILFFIGVALLSWFVFAPVIQLILFGVFNFITGKHL